MSAIIFGLLTIALILVSGYLILIILMQRASSNSGMGAALGGGAAESALGAGAGNVLTQGTIYGSAAFFVLSFGLYLGFLAVADEEQSGAKLPAEISAPEGEEAAAPIVKLPEGMEFSAAHKLQVEGAATEVEGGAGTMTVTVPSDTEAPSIDAAQGAVEKAEVSVEAPAEATEASTKTEETPAQ